MKAHLKHVEALYKDQNFSQGKEEYIQRIYQELDKQHGKYFSGKRKLLEVLINEFYMECKINKIDIDIEVEDLTFKRQFKNLAFYHKSPSIRFCSNTRGLFSIMCDLIGIPTPLDDKTLRLHKILRQIQKPSHAGQTHEL